MMHMSRTTAVCILCLWTGLSCNLYPNTPTHIKPYETPFEKRQSPAWPPYTITLVIDGESLGPLALEKELFTQRISIKTKDFLLATDSITNPVTKAKLIAHLSTVGPVMDTNILSSTGFDSHLDMHNKTLTITSTPPPKSIPQSIDGPYLHQRLFGIAAPRQSSEKAVTLTVNEKPAEKRKDVDYRELYRRTFGKEPDQTTLARQATVFIDGQPQGQIAIKKSIFDTGFEIKRDRFFSMLKPLLKEGYYNTLVATTPKTDYITSSHMAKTEIALSFDTNKQQLFLTTPKRYRLPTPIAVQPYRGNETPTKEITPSAVSGYLNYTLSKQLNLDGNSTGSPLSLSFSEGLYLGGWHLQAESYYEENQAMAFFTPSVRAVRDNVPEKQRVVLGHSIPPVIGLQSSLSMWRVGLDRVYFARDSSFAIASEPMPITLIHPGKISVVVNTRLVGEYTLEEGDYILTDFPLSSGTNHLVITIAESDGTTRTISKHYAYDFSAVVAEDLDYSLSAGIFTDHFGDHTLRQKPVVSAYAKRSWFYPWISGGYLQSSEAGTLLGSSQSIISPWGIFEGNAAVRTWASDTPAGSAFELRYAYLERSWLSFFKEVSLYAKSKQFAPITTYETSQTELGYSLLLSDTTDIGILSVRGTSSYQPDTQVNSSTLSSGLTNSSGGLTWSLDSTLQKQSSQNDPSLQGRFTLGTNSRGMGLAFVVNWTAANVSNLTNSTTSLGISIWGEIQDHRLYAARQTPGTDTDITYRYGGVGNQNLDLSYRTQGTDRIYASSLRLRQGQYEQLSLESSLTKKETTDQWRHIFQNSTSRGTVFASLTQTDSTSASQQSDLALSFASALVFADDKIAISRPIGHNGFVLVYPNKALQGRDILLSDGSRIDFLGPVVLSAPLLSEVRFGVNDIRPFPDNYILEDKQFTVTIPTTAGYKIEIRGKQNLVLRGRLVDKNKVPIPLKSGILRDSLGTQNKRLFSNKNGTFQMGGLSPDTYTLVVGRLSGKVVLPEASDAIYDVGDIVLEEPH